MTAHGHKPYGLFAPQSNSLSYLGIVATIMIVNTIDTIAQA